MYKSSWNLRNFKKGLRFVEEIAKQSSVRDVDYTTGYAIASVKNMRSQGKITKAQEKALEDLICETAEDTIDEINHDANEAAGIHILSD